jgi:Flp pilus assembly protein TadD
MAREVVTMAQSLRRVGLVGTVVVGLLLSATSAFAQAQGSIRGQVMDAAGKPVPEAEVILEYVGDVDITVTLRTNIRGEFTRAGLRTGTWKMQASKGTLIGRQDIKVVINEMTKLEALVIKPPVAATAAGGDAAALTAKEVDARNKLMAAMQADFDAAVTSIATDPVGAIAKLTQVATQIPSCAICYSKIGDAEIKKGDAAAAEAAYKKAIDLDAKLADPYSALAILYNQQKKFDDATAMSKMANELQGSAADPAVMYNQGIIFWNAGKYPEAKAEFEKTIKADPKMAEAHYRLGMANINLGLLPDAVKALEEYVRLSPTGENAEMAKAILKSIK